MTDQDQADKILVIAGADKDVATTIVNSAIAALKAKDNMPRLIASMEAVKVLIVNS